MQCTRGGQEMGAPLGQPHGLTRASQGHLVLLTCLKPSLKGFSRGARKVPWAAAHPIQRFSCCNSYLEPRRGTTVPRHFLRTSPHSSPLAILRPASPDDGLIIPPRCLFHSSSPLLSCRVFSSSLCNPALLPIPFAGSTCPLTSGSESPG